MDRQLQETYPEHWKVLWAIAMDAVVFRSWDDMHYGWYIGERCVDQSVEVGEDVFMTSLGRKSL